MDQLSIPVAEVLRDVGMFRTLEAEGDEWVDKAVRELRTFASMRDGQPFKMEDFRAWVGARLPAPHSHKVWGGFTSRACKAGVIRFTGRYARSVSPKTHAHDVKLWEAA